MYLKPNFFIIGAPKCGTTSLHEYLKTHSCIVMSEPKEPHYFSTDISNGGFRDYSEYLKCFPIKRNNSVVIGESSTLYLYSRIAVKKILNFNPEAKYIVMLRSPLEIARSFHQVSLKVFGETETDFSSAWFLQEVRKKGYKLPISCVDKQLLIYGEIAKIGMQVERLLSIIPIDKIHFIFFDDFKNSTKNEYLKVLKFLNVKIEEFPNFKTYNSTKKIKNPMVTKVTNQAVAFKKTIGLNSSLGLAKKIHEKNIENKSLDKLSSKIISEMESFFKDDINLLSKLLDKDLSSWRR